MGDARRFRNKYSGPGHPWQQARIEQEKSLVTEFGLKTKRELWKADSKLKGFASQAKRLIALRTSQAEIEKKQLLDRLHRLGLLPGTAQLNDVLGLGVKDVLNRRLQTLVFKKGLARTPVQARQFIVHEHVMVGAKKMSAPSYLVPASDEAQISFVGKSTLANPEHPERDIKPKSTSAIAKEAKAKAAKEFRGRKVVRRVGKR